MQGHILFKDETTTYYDGHRTKLWQLNDRVTIQAPSIFAETAKITFRAVSENDNALMFDSRDRCLMIVKAKYFEVLE